MDCPSAPNRFKGLLLMMPPCFPALRLDPDDAGIATSRSTSPRATCDGHFTVSLTQHPGQNGQNTQSEFWRYVPPKSLARDGPEQKPGYSEAGPLKQRALAERCPSRNAKAAPEMRNLPTRDPPMPVLPLSVLGSAAKRERHRVAKKMLQTACRIRRCASDCIHLNGLLPSAATAHTFRMRAYAALSTGGSFFWIPSRCWISCQKETNYGISISGRQRPGSFRPELWHDDARRRRTLSGDG